MVLFKCLLTLTLESSKSFLFYNVRGFYGGALRGRGSIRLLKAARTTARWATLSADSERVQQPRSRFSLPGSTADRLQIPISRFINLLLKQNKPLKPWNFLLNLFDFPLQCLPLFNKIVVWQMFINNLWKNAYVENILFSIYIHLSFWLCQEREFNFIF